MFVGLLALLLLIQIVLWLRRSKFGFQGPRRAGHPFRNRSVKANGWAFCARLKWSRA